MYQYLGNYDLALKFYKQAQTIFEKLDSYVYLPQLYHDLVNIYLIEKNTKEAQVKAIR